jgi:hypothetical protein
MAANINIRHPIALSTSVTITNSATADQTISPGTAGLTNPTRFGMFLDEIRIAATAKPASNTPPTVFPLAYLSAQFTLGSWRLSDTHVPVLLYGSNSRAGDYTAYPSYLSEASQPGTAAQSSSVSGTISWRLPKPLYIPPGDTLIPTFRRLAATYSGGRFDFRVRVTYLGRVVDMFRPRLVDVPYVNFFRHPTGTPARSSGIAERGFHNPFQGPLTIERFVGRVIYENGLRSGYAGWDPADLSADLMTVGTDNGNGVTLKLTGSDGVRMTTDNEIGFAVPFGVWNNSWIVNKVLNPGDYISVEYPNVITNGSPRPMISAIGTRVEALR